MFSRLAKFGELVDSDDEACVFDVARIVHDSTDVVDAVRDEVLLDTLEADFADRLNISCRHGLLANAVVPFDT